MSGQNTRDAARRKRLEEQLRANLQRRKAQARGRMDKAKTVQPGDDDGQGNADQTGSNTGSGDDVD